jgi:hypothetical protein
MKRLKTNVGFKKKTSLGKEQLLLQFEFLFRRSFLNLPSPKRPLEPDDQSEIDRKIRVLDEPGFQIDKTGEAEQTSEETPVVAKKTLKRRNQAIYVEED